MYNPYYPVKPHFSQNILCCHVYQFPEAATGVVLWNEVVAHVPFSDFCEIFKNTATGCRRISKMSVPVTEFTSTVDYNCLDQLYPQNQCKMFFANEINIRFFPVEYVFCNLLQIIVHPLWSHG